MCAIIVTRFLHSAFLVHSFICAALADFVVRLFCWAVRSQLISVVVLSAFNFYKRMHTHIQMCVFLFAYQLALNQCRSGREANCNCQL